MAASFASVFSTYLQATDDAYMKRASQVPQAVSERKYAIKRFLTGKKPEMTLQGGKTIRSFIQLDKAVNAHFYTTGDTESPTQPQTVSTIEVPWRFARTSVTYDDETVNTNVGELSESARHNWYFNMKQQYEAQSVIDLCDLMELGLFAPPDGTGMETAPPTGTIPQSMIAGLTEEANGIPTGYTADGVTTFQGVSPSAKTNWRPQPATYSDATALAESLFTALSRVYHRVGFDSLPMGSGVYSDKRTMPSVWWTGLWGMLLIEASMRQAQDLFVYFGRQDPSYPNPTFRGIPFEYVSVLDRVKAFPTGTAGAYSEEWDTTNSNGGPRFLAANLTNVDLFFHNKMFWSKHPPLTPYLQPSRHTVYTDTYYNLFFHDRRSQGIVYPADTIAGYSGSSPS